MGKSRRVPGSQGQVLNTVQGAADQSTQKTINKPVPLEKSVVSAILKYLNLLPECHAEKTSGDEKRAGRPDVDACLRGRAIKLEVKRPGNNRVTKLQLAYLAKWKAAGAITGVVHSVDEVKQLLEEADLI